VEYLLQQAQHDDYLRTAAQQRQIAGAPKSAPYETQAASTLRALAASLHLGGRTLRKLLPLVTRICFGLRPQ
jgi:hypothetical protein